MWWVGFNGSIVHMKYFEVREVLHTLNLTSSSVDLIVCSPLCQKPINFISIVRYFGSKFSRPLRKEIEPLIPNEKWLYVLVQVYYVLLTLAKKEEQL